MIYVDYRDGSRELIPGIKALGVPVMEDNLDSGDFSFVGNGPNGDVVVGIERKTWGDLIASRDSGRLVERQIPLMCEQYDDRYFIIEGDYKVDSEGMLCHLRWDKASKKHTWVPINFGNRLCTYRELDNMLNTFERKCGFARRDTRDMDHSCKTIVNLYWHYQVEWDKHTSHLSVGKSGIKSKFTLSQKPPSITRLFASQLPGVGYEKSSAVEDKFKTPVAMCLGSVQDWQSIPGIGKVIANKTVKLLNGD